MRTFTGTDARGGFDAVVVRTEFDDARAWAAVRAAVSRPRQDDDVTPTPFFVDDPDWSGASADEVRDAVRAHEDLRDDLVAVFVADRTAMRAPDHALLAVLTVDREDCEDAEDYEALIEFGREFRTAAAGADEIHANLELGNMGFEEYAEAAQGEADGVLRWWH